MQSTITRRTLLTGAGALAALAGLGLAGCSGQDAGAGVDRCERRPAGDYPGPG